MYRRAYVWFSLALAVTLVGFWPSFFSDPSQNDPVRVVHGVLATAWMLMLIAQSWLIAHRHVAWHRRIGKLSYVLAPALIVSMTLVIRSMLTRPHGFPHDLKQTLTFIDLCSVVFFAALYVQAIRHRRNVVLHARYMSATVLVALVPALGRLFGIYVPAVGGLTGALNPSFWVVEAACVLLILSDRRAGLKAAPYVLTLAFLTVVNIAMWQAPRWAAFEALTQRIAGAA